MELVSKIIFGLVVVAGIAFLASLPLYFLWNELMPEIFGLKTITFWQSLGLSIMSSILFKNTSSSKKD